MIDTARSILFLELLGHHLWQGLAVALLVGLGLRLAPRWSASTRYGVWGIALGVVVLLPLGALLPRPIHRDAPEVPVASLPAASGIELPIVAPGGPLPGESAERESGAALASAAAAAAIGGRWGVARGFVLARIPQLTVLLMLTWAMGAALALLSLGRRAVIARRLREGAVPIEGALADWFAEECRAAAPRARPDLLESPEVRIPLALGFIRPAVILPAGFASGFRAREVRHVLLHELAHVVRNDQWYGLLQRIASALLFFHPAVGFIARRFQREREAACDDWAVARSGDMKGYAACLLRVCESLQLVARRPTAARDHQVLAMGAFGQSYEITRRVDNMLNKNRDHRPLTSRATLTVFGVGAALALWAFSLLLPAVSLAGPSPSGARDTPASAVSGAAPRDTADRVETHDAADARDAAAGATPLIRAVLEGDTTRVRRLLDSGADPNETAFNPDGPRSPLNAAARVGDVRVARLLLDRGAEVDRVVPGDATPLMASCREGYLPAARLLLDHGADVNREVAGDGTPLISAVRGGNRALVELLLERGADPDAAVSGDGSPITVASNRGHAGIVRLLLDHGANADAAVPGDGTPLMNALESGEPDTIQALIDGGADVDRAIPGDGTPLIVASRHGDADQVRALLDRGANPDRGAAGDGNPLIVAAGRGRDDVVRLLLDAGADVNAAVEGDGNPLIAASAHGRLDIVRALLDRGADIDAVVPGDETALIQAAGNGHLDIVRLLVERGADVHKAVRVDHWNKSGTVLRSPLGMATDRGHQDVVDYLTRQGAGH